MRFYPIKRFFGRNLADVIKYVQGELGGGIKQLQDGLSNLDFLDNFQSFLWEGEIIEGTEVKINNRFKSIPRFFLVADAENASTIVRGTTWTKEFLYLKNTTTGTTAKVTVIFFR